MSRDARILNPVRGTNWAKERLLIAGGDRRPLRLACPARFGPRSAWTVGCAAGFPMGVCRTRSRWIEQAVGERVGIEAGRGALGEGRESDGRPDHSVDSATPGNSCGARRRDSPGPRRCGPAARIRSPVCPEPASRSRRLSGGYGRSWLSVRLKPLDAGATKQPDRPGKSALLATGRPDTRPSGPRTLSTRPAWVQSSRSGGRLQLGTITGAVRLWVRNRSSSSGSPRDRARFPMSGKRSRRRGRASRRRPRLPPPSQRGEIAGEWPLSRVMWRCRRGFRGCGSAAC